MPSTASLLFPDAHSLWSDYDPSEGRRPYRYFLRRLENKVTGLIEPDKPPMVVVLLNPSTADEIKDDPTVAKSRRHAAGWGYGEVIILNAFAYRATDPKNMKAQPDPIGPKNDQVIQETCAAVVALGGRIVCGWGNHGQHLGRSDALRALLSPFETWAFKVSKTGEPSHPLYLSMATQLVPYPPLGLSAER